MGSPSTGRIARKGKTGQADGEAGELRWVCAVSSAMLAAIG